jgi:hypothetical protein
MAQPVWVLSVDLQTKTATFTTGLADAAKQARGSFSEIKGGAGEMGREVGYSTGEARHSVMMLGEEFGVHLPRSLTTFIAGLGPIGPALEAAFPFLAVILGATLLIEHLVKMREAGEKLTEDQVKFGTAVQNAWNQLDQKILQSQIRADELKNNHLAALQHQLELIDKQSLSELVKSFEEVAKAADVVMKDLEGHWYSFGKGSEGAKHALESFQNDYTALLAKGKGEEASGLLHGTLAQAEKIQEALKNKQTYDSTSDMDDATYQKGIAAAKTLQGIHVETGLTLTKQIEAQQNLVQALNAQVGSEERIAALKKLEGGNATQQEGNAEAARASAAARAAAASQSRISQDGLNASKAVGEAALTVTRATLEERLSFEIDFAAREREVQLKTNAAEIAALDKGGKDYANQLKALQEKTLEIKAEYNAKVIEDTAKTATQINARDLQDFEAGQRQKIDATGRGDTERLAALNNALKEAEARNIQDTQFYRDLLVQRVQVTRQMTEDESKLRAEAGKEEADNELKSGELILSARKQAVTLEESTRHQSIARRMSDEIQAANFEFLLKQAAIEKEAAALDKGGKDYENKLKALQDKEKQLIQQHENEVTNIKEKAEEERNTRILGAETRMQDSLASGLTQSLMRHQTWARTLISLGDQVVTGMIQNALKSILADDMDKERDAAKAARKGWLAGAQMPFPANLVMAPTLAALGFTSVMAFAGGTDSVPGIGHTDNVPTMLTPGEGVVPGGVMDNLRNMAKDGGFNQRPHATVHVHMTNHVNTIDGDGMEATLDKHAEQVQRHVEKSLRKMSH